MRSLHMKPKDARFLKLHLEGKNDGYSLGDLRKIHKFLVCLEGACKLYEEELQLALQENPPVVTPQGQQMINARLSAAIKELNERYADTIEFSVEDEDYNAVKKAWAAMSGWHADSDTRETVLAVDNSLESASGSE